MSVVYTISLSLYSIGIQLASLFNKKAKKWHQGRKNVFDKLAEFAKNNPQNIWLHCASTGEFEQGIPVIRKLQNHYPRYKILVSFFSPSGYEYAASKYPNLDIIYLPIDTKRNADKWVNILNPQIAIFVKYEFWHNYFHCLKAKKTPLLMVSAVFWSKLFFFQWYGHFFKKSLKQVTHFFVQNNESKRLLNNIDLSNVSITGDTRFERTLELKNNHFSDNKIEDFVEDSKVFIVGSAWDTDIAPIIKIILALPLNWKIILAPHEPDTFSYDEFVDLKSSYYSTGANQESQILFIDTIGLLSNIYRYANCAYIGGGFGKGVHNLLEPAVYDIPLFCGPNMQRFEEAKALQELGILQVLKDKSFETAKIVNHLKLDSKKIQANQQYFANNTNVSEQIIVFIKNQAFLD